MNLKKLHCASAAVLSLLLTMNSFTGYADSGGAYTMSIPVSVQDNKGWIPEGTEFTILLKSVDNAPLPDTTEFVVDKTGDYVFGEFVFDEPGDYDYTISEVVYDSDEIIFDRTIYHVHTVVLWNDNEELVGGYSLTMEGSNTKPAEVSFVNDFTVSPDTPTPGGDEVEDVTTTTTTVTSDSSHNSTTTTTTTTTTSAAVTTDITTTVVQTSSDKTEISTTVPTTTESPNNSGSFHWSDFINPHTGVALGVGIPSAFIISLFTMILSRKRRDDDDERSG